ncbi:hypothetical protein GCM10009540_72430 [Streptomyces turgidiscabies]
MRARWGFSHSSPRPEKQGLRPVLFGPQGRVFAFGGAGNCAASPHRAAHDNVPAGPTVTEPGHPMP